MYSFCNLSWSIVRHPHFLMRSCHLPVTFYKIKSSLQGFLLSSYDFCVIHFHPNRLHFVKRLSTNPLFWKRLRTEYFIRGSCQFWFCYCPVSLFWSSDVFSLLSKKNIKIWWFKCAVCRLIHLFCSKRLVFETTNKSKYIDFQSQGQGQGQIRIF